MFNLLFTNERPVYGLYADGEVRELPKAGLLEVSDDAQLLKARRSQWEFNYRTSPKTTTRPPWLDVLDNALVA
jgi:hypothetical protein